MENKSKRIEEIFNINEINIQELRDKGIVETEAEAMGVAGVLPRWDT